MAIIIDNILPRTQILTTTGQTVLDVTWTADYPSDVDVYARNIDTAASDATQKLISADYSVTFIGTQKEVRVTLVTGAPANFVYTIVRATPAIRENFYTNTNFSSSMLNSDTARATMIEQQNQMRSDVVGPRYNFNESITPITDTILPRLPARHAWRKNADDTAIETIFIPDFGLAPNIATYLLQTANQDLPNAQAMGALSSGIVVNTVSTGVQLTRVLTGTVNQLGIDNANGLAGNPRYFIVPNPIFDGTSGMGTPSGTTAQRAVPTAPNVNLRFNTDLSRFEYYNHDNSTWRQLETDEDIDDLILRLAAHTTGDGASMIGLEDIGTVSNKTIQDLAESTIITDADESGVLVNSAQLSSLALLLTGGTMSGDIDMGSNSITSLAAPVNPNDSTNKSYVDNLDSGNVKSVSGTANEVDIDNSDTQNPIAGLSATINAPGTFTIQSTVALDSIIDDDTFATATDSNIATSESTKSYIDGLDNDNVKSVVATANETVVDSTDIQNPIVGLADNTTIPGTAGINIPTGTTVQRVVPTAPDISLRFNVDSETIEYYDHGDSDWGQLPSSLSGTFLQTTGGTMSGDINMDGNLVINLPLPTNDGDSASKLYVDNKSGSAGTVTAGLENELAFYPADGDTVEGLSTANSATLVTSSTGVPSYTASMQDGELLIGVTGGTPVPATLTAGPGISIAQSAGGVTISGTGSGIGWTEVTSTTKAMVSDNGYIANNSSEVVFTLPTTAAVGTVINVVGKGSGGWKIEQNAGQNINIGDTASTAGTGGNVSSTNQHDSLQLLCVTANTVWTASVAPQGNINIV